VQIPAQRPTNGAPVTNHSSVVVFADTNLSAGFSSPTNYPRPVKNGLELQIALACQGISSGSIDGKIGPQTHAALVAFQAKEHLAVTGDLDNASRQKLLLIAPPAVTYVVSSNDLARLQPLSPTWLGKSQQTALDFETLLELLSERGQATPGLVRSLNPGIDFDNLPVGASVQLPNVLAPASSPTAASLTIRLGDRILEAWDENTNLLAHFPCSIARRVERRPVGELHVTTIAHNPNYTFDPENFPESAEAQSIKTKLVLPPGPNNPVGVAWIGLNKPGYGIHGTPNPEQVGRTESHGCFRLANWNAEWLMRMVAVGTPVYVQP
jgi:lipoprotein-anchoring transpeptidase ErfK/SrfK